MTAQSIRGRIVNIAVWSAVIVLLIAGFTTRAQWWPTVQPLFGNLLKISNADAAEGQTDDADDHAAHSDDPNVLKLSEQALKTLAIRVVPLERTTYARSARIPGQVVEIKGATTRDATTGLSGVVAKVYVREGQAVKPGDPLFDIRLIHEEAVQLQLDLIDALAQLEVVDMEMSRLESLNQGDAKLIAGTRIFQQQYKRRQLEHTIATRKRALTLLGFTNDQVTELVTQHSATEGEHPTRGHDEAHMSEHPLIDRVTIHAPPLEADESGLPAMFVVSELAVQTDQHVDSGALLCRLADFRRLYIEGQAFERDLSSVRRATDEGWPITAALTQGDGQTQLITDLKVVYIDPHIDPQTRSARFYVEITNSLRKTSNVSGRYYPDWQYRPGQRIELRAPLMLFENSLIVPAEAVVRDGVENYVFQVSGTTFVRRSVTVLFRDEDFAVLADDQSIFEGTPVATSGAYQLQLALRNRASGPVGGSHAGHSH